MRFFGPGRSLEHTWLVDLVVELFQWLTVAQAAKMTLEQAEHEKSKKATFSEEAYLLA